METQSGRGWLANAFAFFLLILSLWILAALWAGNTFGATFPLIADLRSQIFADYGSDAFGRTLKSLQLTILGDITTGSYIADGSNPDWNSVFQNPVPTATQYGLVGSTADSPKHNENPTEPMYTATSEQEPTNTTEPEPPTETPVPTKTPKPTATSKPIKTSEPTPKPTKKPEPTPKQEDVEAPILSGGSLIPLPGELMVCEIEIGITDLAVEDHPWSSGIEWVKLKYLVDGYSDYTYSSPLTLKSGGPSGEGGWSGCYQGEVHIEIDPGWHSPEPESFHINLWAKARDAAGFEGYLWLAEYTMPASCGGNVE